MMFSSDFSFTVFSYVATEELSAMELENLKKVLHEVDFLFHKINPKVKEMIADSCKTTYISYSQNFHVSLSTDRYNNGHYQLSANLFSGCVQVLLSFP